MRCASCGYETPNKDERFCEACGKPLNAGFANLSKLERSPSSAVLSPTPPQAGSSDRFGSGGNTQTVKGAPARWQQLGWAALAVLLYLTIAEAAAETFLRDSPLRWWIAGTALLYLAVCVAVWRLMPKLWQRLNWTSQTALSILVLLALMGASAWMPGGLEQGLNLFGQPTSIVLAIVSAVAVAISGILLARLRFVPLAGKIVAGLLAAYGVAAFLLAVRDGTPYAALFHGASLWTRLPFWLQGATIGGVLVVPFALLLELVTGLPRIARAKISEFGFKVTALGMSLVMVVGAVRMPANSAMGLTADYDSDRFETPPWLSATHEEKLQEGNAGYKQVSEKLNRMYAALDVVNSKMDRSLFEIDALASRFHSDPAAMLHFVRDEIRYEPYTGVLRGALGTLLCRAGNSLDRSLLLAALLEKGGFKSQIASGQLIPEQAQILVRRLFEPIRSLPSAVPSIAELAPGLSRALGGDQAKLLRVADEVQEYEEKQQKKLVNYVDSETGLLSDLFSNAGVDAGVVIPNEQLVEEASEHYWVQYENSSGEWVDLDSGFADAEPGKAIASATGIFPPDAVPEELYHRLQITLTLRVAQVADGRDGSVNDAVLLDQGLRVADQQGKGIVIGNVPVPMPSATHPGMSLAQAFEPTKGYQTVLQVGSQVTSGKNFDLNGQVSDAGGGSAEGAAAANAGGIGRSLGGLTGGFNSALSGGSVTTTRIVGEWADYKLISPRPHNGAPVTHSYHRDIIAPTQVTSWTAGSPESPQQIPTNLDKEHLRYRLFWFAELLPVTGAIVADYAGYLAFQSFSDDRASIDTLAKIAFGVSQTGSHATSSRPRIGSLWLANGAIQIANNLSRTRFANLRGYFGEPGLVAYETATSDTSDRFKRGYDIVAFPNRIVGHPDSAPDAMRRDASLLHVLVGVLATRLEWALMANSSSVSTAPVPVSNATRVFAAAKAHHVPVVVLRAGEDGLEKLASTSLPDSVKAELSAALATGDDVVTPVRPVVLDGRQQFAWWLFEPGSGQVRGVMPGGRGQGLVEYALTNGWVALSLIACFVDYNRSEKTSGDGEVLVACVGWAAIFGTTECPYFLYEEMWVFFDITSVFLFHAAS
jgi:hypothetical protein